MVRRWVVASHAWRPHTYPPSTVCLYKGGGRAREVERNTSSRTTIREGRKTERNTRRKINKDSFHGLTGQLALEIGHVLFVVGIFGQLIIRHNKFIKRDLHLRVSLSKSLRGNTFSGGQSWLNKWHLREAGQRQRVIKCYRTNPS